MKKLCMLLLASALLLSGCVIGAEETLLPTEPPEIPLETRADEREYLNVTLEYQTLWDENDPEAAVLTQAAAVFENQTGAQVNILWACEGSDQADIIHSSLEELAQCQDQRLDLTEPAQGAGFDGRSHEILRRQVMDRCGSLKGIPLTPYLEGLYYNAELLEKAPLDWTDFLLTCEALRGDGFLPLTMDSADALRLLELHLERTVGTEGLRSLRYEGGWAENERAVAALDQIDQLAALGYVGTGGESKVLSANAVMAVCGNSDCRDMERQLHMDIRWGVCPWPGAEGAGCRVSSDVLAISADCENPQAAFDFIMLLTTGEFDRLRAELTEGIPADPSNECAIAGAMETLSQASGRSGTILGQSWGEMALNLWQGGYESGMELAEALDEFYG